MSTFKSLLALLLINLGASFISSAQVGFKTLANLSSAFNEISGIQAVDANHFYAINDGGNPAEVYLLDVKGALVEKYEIDAPNIDWEDLSASSSKLFIGDFGNNNNTRKDLKILILEKDSMSTSAKNGVQVINFHYEDQTSFPPPQNQLHFDCEALAYYSDSLYLFTKNRATPNTGLTKMYVLPAKPGTYVARLRDSTTYYQVRRELSWITSADIKGNQLLLLSSSDARALTIQEDIRLGVVQRHILFGHFSQKEALTIVDSTLMLITDEKFTGLGGPTLFSYSWDGNLSLPTQNETFSGLWQNGHLLHFSNQNNAVSKLEIYNIFGGQERLTDFNPNLNRGWVDLSNLKNGTYFAIIYSKSGLKEVKKFVWLETNK
jgi:hypothetical protein